MSPEMLGYQMVGVAGEMVEVEVVQDYKVIIFSTNLWIWIHQLVINTFNE
jgi:hypothetical protein